jgi:glycosyltransferase involved in cell wall biosynthesis
MITNRDIICFGEDWGRHPQILEHTIRILLKNNRVIWVNNLGHRVPRMSKRDFVRSWEKIRSAFRRDRSPVRGLYVLRPLAIPLHDFRVVRKVNALLLRFLLRRRMKKLGFQAPILITNSPVITELIGTLGESVAVYYCFDDHTAFEGNLRFMREIEDEVLQKVDVAFFTSQKLLEERPLKPSRSFFTSQGVHTDHYGRFADLRTNPISRFARPIIGFMGLIESENWIDVQLVADLSTAHPEWSFVFIGPSYLDMTHLGKIKNLHFIGPVPYEELPPYVWAFDVGIIPFLLNRLTLACNPIKLFEYFCAGKPVVSTPLPEVIRFEPLATIARTADEFGIAIERLLTNDDEGTRQKRMETASKFTWQKLIEEQSDRILAAEAFRKGKA